VELPEEEWDRIFAVNLKGCYLTMKHVIPIMENQGGGSIVNISSVAGIRYTGVPYSTYYATKAAMIHLTHTTAVQYAPKHIRVNAVLPGLMKTPHGRENCRAGCRIWQRRHRGDVESS
jgi:NAD(P)-dependent dehydrogenase (short-subunit alcohol dehydrogenase family)